MLGPLPEVLGCGPLDFCDVDALLALLFEAGEGLGVGVVSREISERGTARFASTYKELK